MSSNQELKYKLKQAVGEAPWPLIECYACRSLAVRYQPHSRHPWCMKLFCSACPSVWHLCTECSNQRVHLKDNAAISRHNRTKHKEDSTNPPRRIIPRAPTRIHKASSISSRASSWTSKTSNDDENENENENESEDLTKVPPKTFSRAASQTYFEREHTGHGLDYLVGYASFKTDQIVSKMDPGDTQMLMSIALLVTSVSRDQREQVASVLHHSTSTVIRHYEASLPKAKAKDSDEEKVKAKDSQDELSTEFLKWKVKVPTTAEEIRSVICEGKYSLFQNLPHPTIVQRDNHAYMLPSECILDFFGHGLINRKLSSSVPFPPCETIYQSPDSKAMRSAYGMPGNHKVYLTTWSDDFEPNYAKGNRGSVWIRTMTIHTANMDHVALTNVYPIAVGTKNANHDAIDQILFEDITDNAMRPMNVYNGATKKMETVSIHFSLSVQDQPERRSCNRLLLGGSNHHVRYGWRSNPSQCINGLVACSDCVRSLFALTGDMRWTPNPCAECSNWMWFSSHPSLRFIPPDKFPNDELQSDGKLPTIPLTFEYLTEVVSKCHDKVANRQWNKGVATAYLTANGLNSKTIDQIYECASNCAAIQRATDDNNQAILQAIQLDKEEYPDKYEKWKIPPNWDSGLDLQDSVEAGMHILFLGTVERIVKEIQEGMAMRKKGASLRRKLRKLTKKIEGMHLPWCKVQEYYGKELGGWVSENYMGFSRIFPWAYSCIQTCEEEDTYVEPNRPPDKWTAEHNRAWLRVRGLDTSGKAQVLSERVKQYMSTGDPPPILPVRGPTEDDTNNLITATINMISLMMGMVKVSEIGVNVMERLVRVFLTCLDRYDKSMNVKDRSPIVVSVYNFLCLLNIPAQVNKHGPMRNRWEGGILGEGFLRIVKPVVQSSKRKQWHHNLLTNLCRQKTLLTLKAQSAESESEATGSIDLPITTQFRTYSTYAKLYLDFGKAEPLSVVLWERIGENDQNIVTTEFYAVYLVSGQKCLCKLSPSEEHRSTKLGMVYTEFQIETADDSLSHNFDDLKGELSYGLLLPSLDDMSNQPSNRGTMYTCIDCQWRQLTNSFSMDLPHRITMPIL